MRSSTLQRTSAPYPSLVGTTQDCPVGQSALTVQLMLVEVLHCCGTGSIAGSVPFTGVEFSPARGHDTEREPAAFHEEIRLRVNPKRVGPSPAHGPEGAAIQGENVWGADILREDDQSGVCIVEREVGVFPHQAFRSRDGLERAWHEGRATLNHEPEAGEGTAAGSTEEMTGVGEHGIRRQNRAPPRTLGAVCPRCENGEIDVR